MATSQDRYERLKKLDVLYYDYHPDHRRENFITINYNICGVDSSRSWLVPDELKYAQDYYIRREMLHRLSDALKREENKLAKEAVEMMDSGLLTFHDTDCG